MVKVKAVLAEAVWQDDKLRMVDQFDFVTKVRHMGLGEGETVTVRVERPEDAYTYGQLSGYWGYVVKPLVDFTGHTRAELHSMFKAALLVDGQTSITQLNRQEMADFRTQAEVIALEECPDAFERPRELMTA